uniref:Secapin-like protein n=1 Tax=Pelinobius muticus TaxID=753628 RepID=D5J6X9_PELMU|nr:secapin-like protein [Pelinobius muticus]ADF28501.1 secapin-like protein [Pelinobius muticus]
MFSLKFVLLVTILCFAAVATVSDAQRYGGGNRCRNIQCGVPRCPPGSRIMTNRAVSCCPFCS